MAHQVHPDTMFLGRKGGIVRAPSLPHLEGLQPGIKMGFTLDFSLFTQHTPHFEGAK